MRRFLPLWPSACLALLVWALASSPAPASHRHDPYLRKAPWGAGSSYQVTGGYCNDPGGGHSCAKYHWYAVDFGLPEGTNVYATTDSEVVALVVTEDACVGGNRGRAVITKWYDRSLGAYRHVTYAHLQLGSVSVLPGAQLAQGDLLARSGHTGYTEPQCNGPHLHYNEQQGGYASNDTNPSVLPEPMDGQTGLHTGIYYQSTNVWIGFCFGDPGCGDIHAEYLRLGGAFASPPKVGPVYLRTNGCPSPGGCSLAPYRAGNSWMEDFDDGSAYPVDHAHIIQGLNVGHAYVVRDFVWTVYVNDNGGPAGWLGAPKAEETTYSQVYNWQYQLFENGHICWAITEYGSTSGAWPNSHTGCL